MSKSRLDGTKTLAQAVSALWYEQNPGVSGRFCLRVLSPISWVYHLVTFIRVAAYSKGWLRTSRVSIPVISVGNIVVGGSGKTPVVIELCERLSRMGQKVSVISRGYGADLREERVVSDGNRLLLGPSEAGDEPYLIAQRCPGVVVLAGPDRAPLVRRAAMEFGSTIALLDDGMQHLQLYRDLEIVVVDAGEPLGNGCLFPKGPLREPVDSISRADLVWLTRVDEITEECLDRRPGLDHLLAKTESVVVRSHYVVEGIYDLSGKKVGDAGLLQGKRIIVLCGIAKPTSFERTLQRLGATIVQTFHFSDHHSYSELEVSNIKEMALTQGLTIITTEKDAVRLRRSELGALALRVSIALVEGSSEVDNRLQALLG